jgi:hypothetical protein
MGITIIDTAITTQPTNWNISYPNSKAGFQDQLNEAIRASDSKSTLKSRTDNELSHFQKNDSVNQLVHSGKKQDAINLGNARLSSGMLNLYLAQEKKDEKSGKGRAIASV